MKEAFITRDRENSCCSMTQDKLVWCSWTGTGLCKRLCPRTVFAGQKPLEQVLGLVHSRFSSVNTVTVETRLKNWEEGSDRGS